MRSERVALQRWRSGHEAAARRQRELVAAEGARPARAVAEALAALNALDAQGAWPAPRDAVSEREIQAIRRRWVKIQTRARDASRSR